MTTTHDVPMPEPEYRLLPSGFITARTSMLVPLTANFYTADQVRDTAIDYADARCAKLQAELANMRQHVISIAGQLQAERIERVALAEKVKAMEADARPVRKVNPGEVLVEVHGLTGSGKSAVAGEIEILCKALGLQVQWENGDEEKFLTHADWTAALELYNPRVRIVEINTPRPATRGTGTAIDAAGGGGHD